MSNEKKESTFEQKKGQLEFDYFDPKSQDGKKIKSTPIHLDPQMATFGSKDKNEFGGDVQGGLVGVVVNFNSGAKSRITTEQIIDFAVDQLGHMHLFVPE